MGNLHLLLVAIVAFVGVVVNGQDGIVQPNARGGDVVEAVTSRIEASCVFPDDKLLTRRLAYVESYDGVDEKTFRPGYYGGIWQAGIIFCPLFDLSSLSCVNMKQEIRDTVHLRLLAYVHSMQETYRKCPLLMT